MKKTFRMGEMYGAAWENAIVNVGLVLGMERRASLNSWMKIERIAVNLHTRFDCNGNII